MNTWPSFPACVILCVSTKPTGICWQQQGESVSQITAQAAIRWLNENYAEKPFYLHVEFFDPHEPWDPPRRFLEKYMPNAHGPEFHRAPLRYGAAVGRHQEPDARELRGRGELRGSLDRSAPRDH